MFNLRTTFYKNQPSFSLFRQNKLLWVLKRNFFSSRTSWHKSKKFFSRVPPRSDHRSSTNKKLLFSVFILFIAGLYVKSDPKLHRPLIAGFAVMEMVSCYLPLILSKPFITTEEYEKKRKLCHTSSAQVLFLACRKLKGIYAKMGQGLANMHYIIPNEYVEVLVPLRRINNRNTLIDTMPLLKSELGESFEDNFKKIALHSFASASVASVFAGILKDDISSEVAIKIQYETVAKYSESDLKFISFMLFLFEKYDKNFELNVIFERLKTTLMEESDFRVEAANLEKAKEQLSVFPFVYIPKVYKQFSTKRILCMEFIDHAVEISLSKLINEKLSPKDVMKQIIDIFGYQLFSTGFVHADPHSSNILARKSKDNPKKAEIVILDHGLYGKISEEKKEAFAKFWIAGILGNEQEMRKNAVILGTQDYKILWSIIFQRSYDLENKFSWKGFFLEKRKVINLTYETLKKISRVLKEIPSEVLLLLRNINTIQALNKELGNPVNYYLEISKWARSALIQKKQTTFREKCAQFLSMIIFKFYLIKMTIMDYLVNILIKKYNIQETIIEI